MIRNRAAYNTFNFESCSISDGRVPEIVFFGKLLINGRVVHREAQVAAGIIEALTTKSTRKSW